MPPKGRTGSPSASGQASSSRLTLGAFRGSSLPGTRRSTRLTAKKGDPPSSLATPPVVPRSTSRHTTPSRIPTSLSKNVGKPARTSTPKHTIHTPTPTTPIFVDAIIDAVNSSIYQEHNPEIQVKPPSIEPSLLSTSPSSHSEEMENVDKGKERATSPPPDDRAEDVTTPVLDDIFDFNLFNDQEQYDQFCEEVSNMMNNPPSGWESMNVNMLMAISPQLGQILFPSGIPLAQVTERYQMIDQALNVALGYWQRNKPAASAIPSRIHTPAVPSRRNTPRFPDYRPAINLRQYGMSSVPPHFAPPEDPRFRYQTLAIQTAPDHQQAMDDLHQSTVLSMRRGHNNASYSTYQCRTQFNSEAGHFPAITPSNPYGQYFNTSPMGPAPYPYNVFPTSNLHLDAYG